ncbi:MAG: hypothetical protein AAF401_08995 [Pseudomonadota bacterium]
MFRILGWLFAAATAGALGFDVWRGPWQGGEMRFHSIAEIWVELHRPSLIGLNSFTEKSISPGLWDTAILPAVSVTAALAFCLIALCCFFLSGRRRNGRQRPVES